MTFGRLSKQGLLVGLLLVSVLTVSSCQANPVTLSGHLTATLPETMPTSNVQVSVYSDATSTLVAETHTTSAGDFSFHADALSPGTYRVRFSDTDWWQNASDWQHATPVTAGDSTEPLEATVDVATATITGYNEAPNGKPLPYSYAYAYSAETGALVNSAASSEPYSPFVLIVPVGSYYILSGSFWNGQSISHHAATPLHLAAGETDNLGSILDFAPLTWSVEGVVTGAGTPLRGAKIYIFEAEGNFLLTSATTDPSGQFKVNVNPTVDYRALVVDPGGNYQPITWGAPDVTLTGGTTFSLPVQPVDAVLDLGTQDLPVATS